MNKQLRRTIIVTIVETWTLIWANQDGQTDEARVDDILTTRVLLNSSIWRGTTIAQTVSVSSSHVIASLPEFTTGD
jgi:hypothetical protein